MPLQKGAAGEPAAPLFLYSGMIGKSANRFPLGKTRSVCPEVMLAKN
jgi:hypothetical protein